MKLVLLYFPTECIYAVSSVTNHHKIHGSSVGLRIIKSFLPLPSGSFASVEIRSTEPSFLLPHFGIWNSVIWDKSCFRFVWEWSQLLSMNLKTFHIFCTRLLRFWTFIIVSHKTREALCWRKWEGQIKWSFERSSHFALFEVLLAAVSLGQHEAHVVTRGHMPQLASP